MLLMNEAIEAPLDSHVHHDGTGGNLADMYLCV